ncbi:IgGFc-binding protein [Paraliomyxa miuraensis]|uniref:IgGFc-binding protein n=1 Tax=Paraliomyxa miuraensis TaxID=376150 RepID=UPI002257C418|nr:IgGFc-binding protein [Paraliomyxa miuraensis]MCX4242744.1 IgGFc-binding protein [Paraliomyxa miuraensis]
MDARAWGVVGVMTVVGCTTPGSDDETTTTGVITSVSASTTEVADGTSSTGSATSVSGGGSSSSTSSSDGGFGGIFDVGTRADVGEPPGVELTCDNIDEVTATSIGCEFYAVDLAMLSSNELAHGISVGNPGDVVATVIIEDMRGPGNTLREITTLMVDPNDSVLVTVNGTGGILAGQDHQVSSGSNPLAAFHVRSDVPITAMQINPVGGGPSHVAEASLLLPVNALDTSYFAVGQPAIVGNGGFVAVVATEDGTTIDTTGGTTMLDAYDVQVYSVNDATGFFVGSDAPVAVFSGTTCSYIPAGQGACDHLEEQVVPAASWGTTYVGGRHPVRITASNNSPEPVVWRVIAGVDNTTITFTPAVTGPIGLATAGSHQEFSATQSFVAEGTQPFMLVQYMTGCTNVVPMPLNPANPCNEPATGDPYMIQMPPVDQWLDALPFLTDTSYPRDFVVLMREQGTTIDLACLGPVDASHFTAIPGTSYEVGTVDLDAVGGGEGSCVDGEQFVSSSDPIGVIVGGMDWATSYGYAGGLAFSGLWVPPTEPPG